MSEYKLVKVGERGETVDATLVTRFELNALNNALIDYKEWLLNTDFAYLSNVLKAELLATESLLQKLENIE